MKDTIGPLDQAALQYGSMMPDGWQVEIEPPDNRDERESANPSSATCAGNARRWQSKL